MKRVTTISKEVLKTVDEAVDEAIEKDRKREQGEIEKDGKVFGIPLSKLGGRRKK